MPSSGICPFRIPSLQCNYHVLVPSDAVSGITATHLDELARISVLHTNTATAPADV